MLNLIYGTSGSGKSARVLQSICEDIRANRKCYLLVPEQQAYISERELSHRLPSNAGLCFETVNFSKLAEKVFRRFGGCATVSVGNGVRSVLIWETVRRLSPMLEQYGKSKNDASMTAEMLSTLEELRNNGIDGEHVGYYDLTSTPNEYCAGIET